MTKLYYYYYYYRYYHYYKYYNNHYIHQLFLFGPCQPGCEKMILRFTSTTMRWLLRADAETFVRRIYWWCKCFWLSVEVDKGYWLFKRPLRSSLTSSNVYSKMAKPCSIYRLLSVFADLRSSLLLNRMFIVVHSLQQIISYPPPPTTLVSRNLQPP